jgi:hypothetical protein
MIAILLAMLAWCTASLTIGGLMIWRPIPDREAQSEFRNFRRYASD